MGIFKKCENGFKYTDLGEKRNYAIEHSTGEYIVIMDDDDYYFSDSIMAKIRILKHTKLECVLLIFGGQKGSPCCYPPLAGK